VPPNQIWHFDGSNAVRQTGEIIVDGESFCLNIGGVIGERYRFSDLVFRSERANTRVFGLTGRRGWQIGFEGEVDPAVEVHLPRVEKFGRWIDRAGLIPAAIISVGLSAAALFVIVKTPDFLAPLVPLSWEKQLGDAMIGDFGGRFCNGPGGQEALDTLVKRIEPAGTHLRVRVANINMVNAVALPGGTIIIFRGLLQEAKSPDELAGVIGHEIGHVRNRDVMQSLLRQAGLSLLLGGIGGDAGGYANTLVSATYSREAEAEADAYSIKLMKRANISPKDTAGFFARLSEGEEKLGKAAAALGYLSSHPLSKSREAMFRKSADPKAAYTAAIAPQAWRALLESCANDPDVKKDDGLFF
jgi:beta-barrel assembly-enhancing protease